MGGFGKTVRGIIDSFKEYILPMVFILLSVIGFMFYMLAITSSPNNDLDILLILQELSNQQND